jgi:hypothetical protein
VACFSGLNNRLPVACLGLLIGLGDFLVPLASLGPLQSHLDPPRVPSCPKVAIWDDFWSHFGVALELILATCGVVFDAWRLQDLKKRVRPGIQNQKRFFIDFGVCPEVLRRVLAAAGAQFSLFSQCRKNTDLGFHLGGLLWARSVTILTLWFPGSVLAGKMGCRFIGDMLWISR